MRLSVLDQSPISEGSSGADALANTLDLARLTDQLGYHRYWVAEHHGGPMLASASPEALIGPIASTTSGIRIGSAKDGSVKYFIPDPVEKATGTSAAEGVAADAQGNVYGAEVGPRALKRYVKKKI